jgi:hypothetical protein
MSKIWAVWMPPALRDDGTLGVEHEAVEFNARSFSIIKKIKDSLGLIPRLPGESRGRPSITLADGMVERTATTISFQVWGAGGEGGEDFYIAAKRQDWLIEFQDELSVVTSG